jgi:hypothetical protein
MNGLSGKLMRSQRWRQGSAYCKLKHRQHFGEHTSHPQGHVMSARRVFQRISAAALAGPTTLAPQAGQCHVMKRPGSFTILVLER